MPELQDSSDSQLVAATLAGEKDAYRILVTRYQGHVYGLAYSIVGNWHDAQDIAQETFIRAYTNLDQLREHARFAAWLRRVTFSIAMAWVKAHRPALFRQLDGKVDADILEIPDFAPGPAEAAEKRELADAVLRAVASLPPKYRVPMTMFHLDGLSYQKVADFLDIPLGTAKSLISRAQAKLKNALAATLSQDVTPAVAEVFNEHKLPPEFAARVLENVPSLRYDRCECTFAGALHACMKFLKEDFTYPFIMGVSGGAFRILWCKIWCPSSGDLLIVGDEPIGRAFAALGYRWERFLKTGKAGEKDLFRSKIVESIDRGRPVLAAGIIGPPETGAVTGYEKDGAVLLGWSFFTDDAQGYYRKAGWYDDGCDSMIIIGDKTTAPPASRVLRDALEWAVELARRPEVSGGKPDVAGAVYACGLAAYDEWARAMLRDEDFPPGDLKTLTFRCNVCTSVVLSCLRDARLAAAGFLDEMKSVSPGAAPEMSAAADEYRREVSVLEKAMARAPFCFSEEKRRLEMADRSLREFLSAKILEARAIDLRAVSHLEEALKALRAKRSTSGPRVKKHKEERA